MDTWFQIRISNKYYFFKKKQKKKTYLTAFYQAQQYVEILRCKN